MATCKLCNQSGWFLVTGAEGLCRDCESIWRTDARQHIRIIAESLKLIETSRQIRTRLSRIEVAVRSCRELQRYERRGIPTTQTPPSALMQNIEGAKQELVEVHIRDLAKQARTKAQNAATATGRLSPYSKVIGEIGEMYGVLDDVAALERIETEIRAEMDRVRLETSLEKAEKAEFKGQGKRAIDGYLDALFIARRDSIPDELQSEQIAEIEGKIRALGGTVPAPN